MAEDAGAADAATEHRFQHLLQPIRDLASSWNIDIAHELESYLGELDHIRFRFDSGATAASSSSSSSSSTSVSLNFAEAALLIQGSACIYSKKVEYLYSLVFRTLELLAEKRYARQAQQGTSIAGDGRDADVFNDGDEPAYLMLDDIPLDEASNINLREDGEDDDDASAPRKSADVFAAHAGGSTLLPPMLFEGGDLGASAMLVTRPAALLPSVDPRGGKDFKMHTAMISDSGALLLDAAAASIDATVSTSPAGMRAFVAGGRARSGTEPSDDDDDNDGGDDAGDVHEGKDANSGDDVGGPGFEMNAEESDATMQKPPARAAAPARPVVDPWVLLDAHSVASTPNKPFRRLQPRRPPRPLAPTSLAVAYKAPLERLLDDKCVPLRGSVFADVQRLLAEKQRVARAAHLKVLRERAAAGGAVRGTAAQPDVAYDAPDFAADYSNDVDADADDGSDFADAPEYDGGAASDDALGSQVQLIGGGDGVDSFTQRVIAEQRDASALAAHAHARRRGDAADADLSSMAASQLTYEQLCRRYIDATVLNARQYAQEGAVIHRVEEWHTRIRPMLEEIERRPAFDMEREADDIVERLQRTGVVAPTPSVDEAHARTFDDVVAHEERWHVCRMFSAVLQLANEGRVQIIPPPAAVAEDDTTSLPPANGFSVFAPVASESAHGGRAVRDAFRAERLGAAAAPANVDDNGSHGAGSAPPATLTAAKPGKATAGSKSSKRPAPKSSESASMVAALAKIVAPDDAENHENSLGSQALGAVSRQASKQSQLSVVSAGAAVAAVVSAAPAAAVRASKRTATRALSSIVVHDDGIDA